MGKIRIRTLGSEGLEEQEKKKIKEKKEQKKAAHLAGMKDSQRVMPAESSQEGLKKENVKEAGETGEEKPKKKLGVKSLKKKPRGKKYSLSAKLVDKTKTYDVLDGLKLLNKIKFSRFDETVELHLTTAQTGISGSITLPHGSGKSIKIKIASPSKDPKGFEELLDELEKGNYDFDMLLATPDAMAHLAKYARFLGPKGLMPNPKNGTVTNDPQKVAERFAKGEISFKTEAKFPIIHLAVGRMSFGEKKLLENIQEVSKAITATKVKKAVLKSTMSPGIKISF
ncbi:50S ribosomal protein L1 [Patescibacteria group bacterium]|nr:50S ribosomal protein L1 [Patescibacteria group bacterium]